MGYWDNLKMRPYLVQRVLHRLHGGEHQKGVDRYFAFDYMGSSEFEFGALPASLKVMRAQTNVLKRWKYHLGNAWYYGPEDCVKEAFEFFQSQLQGLREYDLKERTSIKESYELRPENDYAKSIIGWWALSSRGEPSYVFFKSKEDAENCLPVRLPTTADDTDPVRSPNMYRLLIALMLPLLVGMACSSNGYVSGGGTYIDAQGDSATPFEVTTGQDVQSRPDLLPSDPCYNAICDDSNACTVDTCDSVLGCLYKPLTNACDDGNPCTDDQCLPASGCLNKNNSHPCNDTDLCTTNDKCKAGSCTGTFVSCEDGDPCTADTCQALSGCTNSKVNGPNCNDGDACTGGDLCTATGCKGGAVSCDDGNVCTLDVCNPKSGCANVPADGACDDGDACTEDDACKASSCLGTATDCDDGVSCTTDACLQGLGCQSTAKDAACDDGNGCTEDACDALAGCTNTPIIALCDDGDACTTGDLCKDGLCASGAPLVCDDGNGCTDESCHKTKGCVFVNNTMPCDDANPCTDQDSCAGGVCASKPKFVKTTLYTTNNGPNQYAYATVYDATPVKDGLVLVGGKRSSQYGAIGTGLLLHIDTQGNKVWERTYPHPKTGYEGQLLAMGKTDDGFVLSGGPSLPTEPSGLWVVRVGNDGNPVWSNVYNDENYVGNSLAVTNDGYVVSPGPSPTLRLVKLDVYGNKLWGRSYGWGHGYSSVISVGTDFVVATSKKDSIGSADAVLIKLNAAGDIVWQKSFDDNGYGVFDRVIYAHGVLAAAGRHTAPDGTTGNLFGVGLDGGVLWQQVYTGGTAEALVSVDNGFVISSGRIIRTDVTGIQAWVGAQNQTGVSVQAVVPVPDGMWVVGKTYKASNGASNWTSWVSRTDAFSNTTCQESGACAGLTFTSCDDADPCTLDLCDPAKGCTHKPTDCP